MPGHGLAARIGAGLATEREPEADALLLRELPNLCAAWRLARERGALDAAMVVPLHDEVAYQDLVALGGQVAADCFT